MAPRQADSQAPTGRDVAADDGAALSDVLRFMRLLWALDHGLQRASKRMQRRLGVTGPQRLAVRLIGTYPGIAPGELASLLHLHPSTLTGVLARLLDRGLIARESHPSDGRRSLLQLTRAGHRVDALRTGTVEETVERLLRTTPRTEQRMVSDVLARLADALMPGAAGRVRRDGPATRLPAPPPKTPSRAARGPRRR